MIPISKNGPGVEGSAAGCLSECKESLRKRCTFFSGYDEIMALLSKPIIDEIDRVLAKHYGFTDEELDFIVNYEIKYRMGQGTGEGEGE